MPTNSIVYEEFLSDDEAISAYFALGYNYVSIVEFLSSHHNIDISLRTLKRRLRTLQLRRRRTEWEQDINRIRQLVIHEIQSASQYVGYRTITSILSRKYNIRVPRTIVSRMMRQEDPEGVYNRRLRRFVRRQFYSPGPNYTWHVDGYDKLKPYGICIHACICGFSRRILWLELGPSNNNPEVIAKYFVDTVEYLKCCPVKVSALFFNCKVHFN